MYGLHIHAGKTIGLLLCRGKDEVMAQYALSGYNQPIGVSDYQLSKAIPEDLKSALPTIEEVEEELSNLLDNKGMDNQIFASKYLLKLPDKKVLENIIREELEK